MPWEVDEYLNKAISQFVKQRYNWNDQIKKGFESDTKRIEELANLHIKCPELQPPVVPLNLGNGLYELRLNDLGNNINGQYFRYMFYTSIKVRIRKGNCTKTIDTITWQIDDNKTWYNCPSWTWNRIHANLGKSTIPTTTLINGLNQDSRDYTLDLTTGSGNNEKYINDDLKSIYFDTTNKLGVQEYEIVEVLVNYIKRPNRVFIGGYNHIDKHSTSLSEPIHCDLDDAFHDEIIKIAVNLASQDIQDQFGVQINGKKVLDDYTL
jgi:hypothetical protein